MNSHQLMIVNIIMFCFLVSSFIAMVYGFVLVIIKDIKREKKNEEYRKNIQVGDIVNWHEWTVTKVDGDDIYVERKEIWARKDIEKYPYQYRSARHKKNKKQ